MLVFVDESGDTGFKLDSNSSTYFTVAAVVFVDREEARRCDRSLADRLRQIKGLHEFRFSAISHDERVGFLTHAIQFDFYYAAVVVDKAKLTGPGFRFKESLIKTTLRFVFTHLRGLENAIVIVDRSGNRDFRRTMQTYLQNRTDKRADGTSPIKRLRFEKSHSNMLIQLADMVCGAVARSFNNKRNQNDTYRNIIKGKERRVQLWPK